MRRSCVGRRTIVQWMFRVHMVARTFNSVAFSCCWACTSARCLAAPAAAPVRAYPHVLRVAGSLLSPTTRPLGLYTRPPPRHICSGARTHTPVCSRAAGPVRPPAAWPHLQRRQNAHTHAFCAPLGPPGRPPPCCTLSGAGTHTPVCSHTAGPVRPPAASLRQSHCPLPHHTFSGARTHGYVRSVRCWVARCLAAPSAAPERTHRCILAPLGLYARLLPRHACSGARTCMPVRSVCRCVPLVTHRPAASSAVPERTGMCALRAA